MKIVLRPLPIDLLVGVKYRLENLNWKPINKERDLTGAIPVPEKIYAESINEIKETERLTGLSLGFWAAKLEQKYIKEA